MIIVVADMQEKPTSCAECQYCIQSFKDYVCTLTGVIEQDRKMDTVCPLIELDIATETMLKEFTNIE